MNLSLVAMPWQALEAPSLPIGLLQAELAANGREKAIAHHGSIGWAEYMMTSTGDRIGCAEYVDIAENGIFHGLGDWVFAGDLAESRDFGVAELAEYLRERPTLEADVDLLHAMRSHAREWLRQLTRQILETDPHTVGFTTTFMQNVSSLACARLLKAERPHIRIIFGGGNCDGDMGVALHRNFQFVDFVVRGEGEQAFIALLEALDGDRPPRDVPGLVWREQGEQRVNPPGALLAPGRLRSPDYDDWFDRFNASPVAEQVEPKLVVETARGCWWGERHHCTFCGLNGTAMTFRAKEPDRAADEILDLVARHHVLDVIAVDNIIDNRYFKTLLPALAKRDLDLHLHYEVKSNLSPTDIASLRDGHVHHVQPGIESLSTSVLKLMDKGVTGARNVRVLRDLETAGITVSWNWLYGFPGEDFQSYADVITQIRNLVHLQPPASGARILLERFSPHFDQPELGFGARRPAAAYRHVYDLPDGELTDLVYLFDTRPQGLRPDQAAALTDEVHWWRTNYAHSSLTRDDRGGTIEIRDRRAGRPPRDLRIERPAEVAAYRALEHGHSVPALESALADQGFDLAGAVLRAWLDQMQDFGLLFAENGQLVAVATAALPVKATP